VCVISTEPTGKHDLMGWSTSPDLDRFEAAAGGYLRARAAENTLLLSAAQAARSGRLPPGSDGPATGLLFGWWEPPDGGGARAAFLHDPAAPLLISGRVPEMASALAATLARLGRPVSGVDAPVEAADAFAAAWSQRAGSQVRVHRHVRVYRLSAPGAGPAAAPAAGPWTADWPPPELPDPAGRLHVAGPADQPLLARWLAAYGAETGERLGAPAELAADLASYGGAVFWEEPHRPGQRGPAALVALARPVAGTVAINFVYVPPERRGSGGAVAATLAVSRAVLADGADEVVLITDRSRPGPSLARLGFQLAGERAVLRFGPVTGALPRLRETGATPRLSTGPLPRLRR
jgi:hypothetical protein